jgi:hypothetical protein
VPRSAARLTQAPQRPQRSSGAAARQCARPQPPSAGPRARRGAPAANPLPPALLGRSRSTVLRGGSGRRDGEAPSGPDHVHEAAGHRCGASGGWAAWPCHASAMAAHAHAAVLPFVCYACVEARPARARRYAAPRTQPPRRRPPPRAQPSADCARSATASAPSATRTCGPRRSCACATSATTAPMRAAA